MKKSSALGILGFITAAVSSYGQGAVFLDNYFSDTYNPVIYSTALGGGAIPYAAGFTVQLYYDASANADVTGAINTAEAADSSHAALPSALNGALIAATGPGSTAPIWNGAPGYFAAASSFLIQLASASPPQNSYSLLVVAYNGSSYDTSTIRGYSTAIYVQDAATAVTRGADLGLYYPSGPGLSSPLVTVYSVPEPGTLALAGLGGLSLLLMRRKKT